MLEADDREAVEVGPPATPPERRQPRIVGLDEDGIVDRGNRVLADAVLELVQGQRRAGHVEPLGVGGFGVLGAAGPQILAIVFFTNEARGDERGPGAVRHPVGAVVVERLRADELVDGDADQRDGDGQALTLLKFSKPCSHSKHNFTFEVDYPRCDRIP